LADPFLDLRLFSKRTFSVSVATNTIGVFVAFGGFLYIAQYLQFVLGLSPLQAGLWSLPGTVAVIVTSNLTPMLARHIRPAYLIALGLLLGAVGYGLLTQIGGDYSLAFLVVGNIVMSAGFGMIFIPTSEMVISAAPPERAGAASAISETGSEFGGALGIAILGSLGTSVYRSVMANSIPSGVPAELAEAARDTLGGAVVAAGQLPEQLANSLLNASFTAFSQGLHLTATIATVLMIGTAILAVTVLRNVQTGAGHHEEPSQEIDGSFTGNDQLETVLVPIPVPVSDK
jgi:DHA2 family multidrug resistance protein-like MFS transporter